MFRTKKDVDRHVQELFRKLKGEKERKSKYFSIGRLYLQVGDYEAARKYASIFLSIRGDSAAAHKLLGQALEALGQKENALAEFKCSLDLESNQPDLVLKVCELMADADVKIDKGIAKVVSERADQLFPHHPSVFKLKEKLVSVDDDCNAAELEKLVLSELSARPKDVSLHIRLLNLHLDSGRINDAYSSAVEVEMRCAFREDLKWYECLVEVFKAYGEWKKPCGWEFYFHYVGVLERAASLNLQEQYGTPRRTWAQTVNALFNFDQILEVASGQSPPSSEVTMFQEFIKHMRAQLCLHFATALFKKAKKEPSTWVDLSRPVAPLLLNAMVLPVDAHAGWVSQTPKCRWKGIEWWAKDAAYRNSQAGHLLQSLVMDRRSHFLERVAQFCTGNWRERLYQKIFNTRDHQQAIGSSHLIVLKSFAAPSLRVPSTSELRPHDEMAQRVYPNSLHHMVWLGLRELSACCKRGTSRLGIDFRCLVFENLQFSCSNPSSAGSETLCQLDIDAFLYTSVLCTKAALDEEHAAGYRSGEKPELFPANITEYLCTIAQAKWWTAAYRVYTNQARSDLGEVRQILQRGVEVVRVLGNHGLDVRLIVQLARIFSERANIMSSQSRAPMEMMEVEARAAMYWTSALPLLDKLQRNQTVRAPHNRLFEYKGKDLSMAEINTLLEEGRYFLALQMMKEEKYEKALESFQQLKSPYASFHQANIYKKLAAQEVEDQQGELITSEMRSRHIILLTKVRECLYLTLDRLRSPGVDRKHPLNAELSSHIEEIESQLARIDPDVWRGDANRNDLEAVSDGSLSSGPSAGENGNSFGYSNSFVHFTPRRLNSTRVSSTPYRHTPNHSNGVDGDTFGQDSSRRLEARPSPERLDAQIRHLMHWRDAQMQQVMQQNKALLESHRSVADNLNKVAHSLEELKNLIQELVKKDMNRRSESHLNSDLPQVGDPDDDLYVFDDDYSEDVNISNMGQYQTFPPQYPNYTGTSYRQVSGMIGSSTVPYGPAPTSADSTGAVPPQLLPPAPGMSNFFRNMDPSLIYPQTLGYYGQGALPFSEGQQLPDFRATAPTAPAGSVFSRLGPATAPGSDAAGIHPITKPTPPSQPAPVNVVITSSDTLPTTVPPTQPTLSVTIPPQHLLGTPLVHATVPPPAPGVMAQPPGVPPVIPPAVSSVVPPPVVAPGVPVGGLGYPNLPAVPAAPLASAIPGQLPIATGLPPSVPAVTSASSTVLPHAFQITMPPQAQVPVASRLEKGAAALSPVLPISTQTLLSSVPSPVYSAVGFEKSGKEQPGTPVTTTTVSSGPGTPATPVGTKAAVTSPPKIVKAQRVSTGSVASEDGAVEVEHDPCPDFQPVIPLPAEVEVPTGEEQEEVLYECRCKLFRYVDKEWKERGVGQMKLLHHKENGKVRLLMRREQVLKVCANHFLAPDMSLTRMNEKAWIWVANDFADEEVRLEKLCVRFKTSDDANKFADAFKNACDLSKEAKTTPVKDISKASEVSFGSSLKTSMVTTDSLSVASSPSEKIVVGGFTFSSPPKFTSVVSSKTQAEKDAVKEKEKGTTASKPSPFAQFSFTSKSSTDTAINTISTNIFGGVSNKPVFGGTSILTSSVSSPSTSEKDKAFTLRRPALSSLISSASPAVETIQKDRQTEASAAGGDPLMFKASNLPTFSALASTGSDKPAFQKATTFKGFEGAGTPLFSKSSTDGKEEDKSTSRSLNTSGKGEEENEDFVPTQEFTPVIALPALVEVKTGEEGQEIVFQERAKLLRFDSDTRQWKERGTGTMKILKDPSNGRVRLLMRREQVLKVCCNHLLTKAMKFEVLQTCDKAWSWIAEDYSEGEMKGELLALRFKTREQAQNFGAKVAELQSQMVNDKIPVSSDKLLAPRVLSTPPPQEGDKLKLCDMFAPAPGSWVCNSCYVINESTAEICVCCREKRVIHSPPKTMDQPFKPKQGSWECRNCFTRNEESDRECSSCGSRKHSSTPLKQNGPSDLRPFSEMFKPKVGSWKCETCYIINDSDAIECMACTNPKPGCEDAVKEKKKTEPPTYEFNFGLGQNTGFSFGIPNQSVQESVEKVKTETSSVTTGLSFGNKASTQTIFGAPTTQSSLNVSSAQQTLNFGAVSTQSTNSQPNAKTLSQPVFGWTFGATTTTSSVTIGGSTTNTTFTTSSTKTQSSVVSSTTGSKAENEKPFSFDAKPVAFQFGITSSASKPFNFGVKETQEKKDSPQDTGPRNFVFGSPESFEFSFSGVQPKSPVKSPKSAGVIGASGGEDDSCSEPEEDEGEHIYFQPVVPLPDKVPLHTGEEEEDVLYSHRAKLYRFVDGAWKERGVGDIKILKHQESHKVRLVMRREQVLKLCLNHFLTTDMTFTEKDEKSWLWIAADFAEGEIQQEKLAIRFQNKDIASAFKKAIDEAQTYLGIPTPKKTETEQSTMKSSTEIGKETNKDGVVRSLFGGNSVHSRTPTVLDLSKSDDDVEVVYQLTVTSEEKAAAEKLMLPPNFFSYKKHPPCPGCCGCEPDSDSEDSKSTQSNASKSSVLSSSQDKIAQNQSELTYTRTSSFSTSSTILPPTTKPSTSVITPSLTAVTTITTTTAAAASATTTTAAAASTPTAATTTTFGELSTPLVSGSNLFGKNLFGSPQNGGYAFSTTSSSTPTSPSVMSATSKSFTSFSFSPSENKDIKVASSPVSGGFLFGGSSSTVGQKSETTSIFGKQATTTSSFGSTPSVPSVFSAGSPSTFSQPLFGQLGNKTGLFGQTSSDGKLFPSGSVFGSSSTTTASATPVFGLSLQTSSGNTDSTTPTSQFSVKSLSQPNKPFVFNITSTTTSNNTETEAEEIPSVKEERKDSNEHTEEGVPFLPTDSSLTFTSLASQSKQLPFVTGSSDTNFSWKGAGAQVFGAKTQTDTSKVKSSSPKKGSKSGGEDSSDDDGAAGKDDAHDPHFEPIVALPDAIEVRTGEEDEEKVFCQRAKLYRYEVDSKQWKERGVGEMKILKHPGRGTYRLLLRREQVHKVVLNQLVCADLELSPLSASDVAWCWGGVNFAEDDTTGEIKTDPKPEKLAVKFKNIDLAKEFAACVSQCVEELKSKSATASLHDGELMTTIGTDKTIGEEDPEREEETDDDDEDEEDEIDDDENEDYDADRNVMFEKRATLEAQGIDGKWEKRGMGLLQIFYDADSSLARVCMHGDSESILCNTLIMHDTDLEKQNKDCIWRGLDYSVDPPANLTFKARFSSASSADEFDAIFSEGSEIAQQQEIPDSLDTTEVES